MPGLHMQKKSSCICLEPHDEETHFSSMQLATDLITHRVQPEHPAATESMNPGASLVEVAAGCCRVCGKSPEEVPFSNSQQKRLKKGKVATCKSCASPANGSGPARKAVTGTELSEALTGSTQMLQVLFALCSFVGLTG